MADDVDYGRAVIRVSLDDSEFVGDTQSLVRRTARVGRQIGRGLRREIDRALAGISASVDVTADMAGLRSSITSELAGLTATVDVEANTRALRRSVNGALTGLTTRTAVLAQPTLLRASVSEALDGVTFRARIVAQVSTLRASIRAALSDVSVNVRVIPDNARAFRRILQDGLDRLPPVRVPVVPDTSRFSLSSLRDDGSLLRLSQSVSSVTSAVASLAGTLARGVGLALLAAEAAAAAGALVQLTAALAPAAGILAALPASIAGAGVAFGVLAAAVHGVGDAFTAALTGDAEEFAEAIEGLAPAAQSVARELRRLRPELTALQQTLQQAFFRPIAGEIERLGEVLARPAIRRGLEDVASDFGEAAAAAADFAASDRGVSLLEEIILGTRDATEHLAQATRPVTQGFLELAAAVQEAFGERLGDAIGDIGQRFGAWATAAAESGQAVAWVEDALDVFRQLGAIAADVGTIFGAVGDAIDRAGGDALGVFGQVVNSVAELASSEAGISAMAGAFRALNQVGAALAPVLGQVVTELAELELGGLVGGIEALAPSLRRLASGLSDALDPVLAVLPSLGSALGGLVDAAAPLLPIAGQLAAVVGGVLVEGLRVAAQLVGPLARGLEEALSPEQLGGITTAVGQLGDALAPVAALLGGALAEVLPPLARALGRLLDALVPLGTQIVTVLVDALAGQVLPALAQLLPLVGDALALVAEAAGPLVEILGVALTEALETLLPIIVDQLAPAVLDQLLPALLQLLEAVRPLLPPLIQLSTQALVPLIGVLPTVVEFVAALVEALTPLVDIAVMIVGPLLQIGTAVTGWLQMEVVVPVINGVITALRGLATAVGAVLQPIRWVVEQVVGFFQWLYDTLIGNSIIPDLITGIQTWFASLPGRILELVAGLVGDIVAWFASLPGRVYEAVLGLGSLVASAIGSAAGAAVAAAGQLVADVVAKFAELPGLVADAIGDLGDVVGNIAGSAWDTATGWIPGFADGGIVASPTVAMVGEAGPEVVVPLTRPARARQLVEQSGLLDVIGAASSAADGRGGAGAGAQHTHYWTIHEAGDAHATAQRVVTRMALAGGML